jgi:uncharacterized protein (TIGR01244 family)
MRQLSARYFVSPQISPEDVDALAAAGVTRILCNRPDEEVPPSHCAETIRAAAEAAGLSFAEQPLSHQNMVPDVITHNRTLGADTGDVVLAYCASGTRSCIAWALGQAGTLTPDEIIEAAERGGYDLSHLRQILSRPFT